MPVICHIPQDPTDLVIQGELMRLSAISGGVHVGGAPTRSNALVASATSAAIVLAGQQSVEPMHPDFTPYGARLRDPFAGTVIASNACISTPCGSIIPVGKMECLIKGFVQATDLWKLEGVTRDNLGAPLGNCAVIAFETGRLAVGGAPVEGQTISDGSGNYTIPVALNTHYEVTAYLAGAPDVAGITLRSLTPVPA